jgi:hypothetical protein
LMVIKLDRFARSLVDPELPSTSSERNVKLCLSDSIHANRPLGRLLSMCWR